jgi:serine/threonine protein kinase
MPPSELSTLLARWLQAYEQGQELSPAELCPEQPELAEQLNAALEPLRRMNGLVTAAQASTDANTAETLPPPAEADSQRTLLPPPGFQPPAAPTLAPPGYEILGELGRGGMGVVYKARQLGLQRIVALKMVLAAGHAGTDDLDRFRHEAQALARLQHSHIVQVYEVGEHLGQPFFSLEFCPGGSLDEKLAGNPLPAREAAELVRTLAEAVHAAHQAAVVHRDLKPANVLLTGGPDTPLGQCTPKIGDFGLAKRLDVSGATQTGAVMGTPCYMAPEQAQGKGKQVGPAADVYALGVILYECLTGRVPFKGTTLQDTLTQVVCHEPVPPGRLQPRLSQDVETICLKCLDKNPSRRYASAQELADDLNRFRQGNPIQARRPSLLTQLGYWIRRPERVVNAGVIMLCLAGLEFPGFLAVLYYLLDTWLGFSGKDRPSVSGPAIFGTVLGPILSGWIGYNTISRRPWALWAGLVLLVPMNIFSLSIFKISEAEGDILSYYVKYFRIVRHILYQGIPILAYLIAIYAYYCNRDTLPQSSPG